MLSRSSALLLALSAGLVVGIAYPYVDIAIACRAPMSEACVWGKAYFSLTLTVSVVLLGGVVAGVVYVVLRWRRDRQSRGDAV
jgi:xanthosine utilization system XapX-like protein